MGQPFSSSHRFGLAQQVHTAVVDGPTDRRRIGARHVDTVAVAFGPGRSLL